MPQNPNQITCSILFTPGRSCAGPTAVVLHEWKSGIENLDHEMCRCLRPRPLQSPGCHTSFHYGVGGNCNFRQYVADANTAWGFYFIPTPACPTPPCPIVQTCDGIGADQYNPEEDGTLPTPVVAAGADLTANCSVIHVAIATGAASTGSGIYCINSPHFSEFAYRCLVQSLCYIFDFNGITPDGYSTLLTHIGELMDLDLDQLAIDIQACLDFVPPPLPPCNCSQTQLSVVDTSSINLGVSGTDNHTLTASVKLSATAGNLTVTNVDGLYTPETPIAVVDTNSVNLTVSGTNTHTITANVVISPNAGNQVSTLVNGLFVPEYIPCKADPVIAIPSLLGADVTLDVTSQLASGKQIFLADTNGGLMELVNPPIATCQEKEIWIKNINVADMAVTSANLIDGQGGILLKGTLPAGYPFGNNGGDAVHLVWSTALTTWFIL